MSEALRLYGLKAVVTNAAAGIGEAIARTLAKHGAGVLAIDSDISGVEQQFEGVKDIDVLVDDQYGKMSALIDVAIRKMGTIDILINDFPLLAEAPIECVDDRFNDALAVRARMIDEISHAAMPKLQTSPAGRIINIGSLRSQFGLHGQDAASADEQALAEMTRQLAIETGQFGITVNYVQPGAIMTPASRERFLEHRELRDYCIASSAARRLGEPVDVAKVVLFLASGDAVFVSGTGIAVDGGCVDVNGARQ